MGNAAPRVARIDPREGTRPPNKPLSASAGQEGGHILHPLQDWFCRIYHTLLANMTQPERHSVTGSCVSVVFMGRGGVKIPLISRTQW